MAARLAPGRVQEVRIVNAHRASRLLAVWGVVLGVGLARAEAYGQVNPNQAMPPQQEDSTDKSASSVERFKELTDPEHMLEKRKKVLEKEKQKPPFEFFRSQVQPFDILPYVKANHWNTMTLELRANLADYNGILQSAPVPLRDMPHEVFFRRDARLVHEQTQRLAFQIMFPHVQKEITLELTRPDAIRGEGAWPASLMELLPHQMLIPILSPEPSVYTAWGRFLALVPASGDKDTTQIDRQRYYRLVQSQDPERLPALSTHPLTWSAISHIIWDGILPEKLNVDQQQAMIDWLHFGGQLIIVGGAGPSLTPLQESFLAPYLPATVSGQNETLGVEDLKPLVDAYPESVWPTDWLAPYEGQPGVRFQTPTRYRETNGIKLGVSKGVFLSGLTPLPGSTPIPLGDQTNRLLGVERRVGRGRILMLAIKPTDARLQAWPGIDTLVRRVILRRPEEFWAPDKQAFGMLSGRDLTWVRYLARDLEPPGMTGSNPTQPDVVGDVVPVGDPVGAWLDGSRLPVESRKALQKASGITIPGRDFVLWVILAYGLALVPLNWLVCRFVLRKRELAWVIAPILAFGFAIVVERAAAYDMGFDSACDEIDLLELQGDYPRGHLSRFAAVYSTGRMRYTIAYPDDPTALALPMSMENQLRGEETLNSVWQSSPVPALMGFPVQPRSLAMFRSEQMINLPGGIALETKGGTRHVVNNSGLTLRDAVLVEVGTERRFRLGEIAPAARVAVGPAEPPRKAEPAPSPSAASGDPGSWLVTNRKAMAPREPFLDLLRSYDWRRPEDRGEWRLVAWADQPHPGERFDPGVDRHRGFRLVVAHLQYGSPPDPTAKPYYSTDGPRLEKKAETTPPATTDDTQQSQPQ
jgi:hypothetical protein